MEEHRDIDLEREAGEYNKVCGGIDDPVLLVIRAHLYTEYLLDRTIVAKLKRGDRIVDQGTLQYSQKLELAHSFDFLRESDVSSLKQLNKVRNRCAHELQKEISIADIDLIGRPLGKMYTIIRKEEHKDVLTCLKRTLASLCGGLAAYTHALEEEGTQ